MSSGFITRLWVGAGVAIFVTGFMTGKLYHIGQPTGVSLTSALCAYDRSLQGFLRRELQAVQRERSLDACKIKIVGAKNLQVTKLIPQAELVISLELATMAGSADTLKVFAAVGIANS